MATKPGKKLHSIAVRLDDETLDELRAVAAEEQRTLSNMVALLIRRFLNERRKQA